MHSIRQNRHEQGPYVKLVTELQLDGDILHQYMRLTREQFARVLFHVEDDVKTLQIK